MSNEHRQKPSSDGAAVEDRTEDQDRRVVTPDDAPDDRIREITDGLGTLTDGELESVRNVIARRAVHRVAPTDGVAVSDDADDDDDSPQTHPVTLAELARIETKAGILAKG